ncbi:flippase [Vibrio breoganii]
MIDNILRKNIVSLFSMRIASYIVPLITIPYLVKTLGATNFGMLSFSLAIIQYFVMIVNYGFDLNTTKKIAESKHDKNKVSEIFWSVISARILLAFLGIVIIYIISLLSSDINNVLDVIIFGYIVVIGTALFPQWLFQGKEQLGVISTCRIIIQLLTIPLFFLFVNSPDDISMAAFISGISPILLSMTSYYLIVRREWISFIFPRFENIRKEMIDSWPIFLSSFAGSMYLNSLPVILGFVATPTSVAIYVAADKLVVAAQGIYTSLSSAFYPRINYLYSINQDKAISFIKYALKIQLTIALIATLSLFGFSSIVVELLYGKEFVESALVLKILSPLPIIIGIGSVLGIQTLLVFGYKKELSSTYLNIGVLSLFISIPLSIYFDYIGTAISIVIIELLVSLSFYFKAKRRNLNVFHGLWRARSMKQ